MATVKLMRCAVLLMAAVFASVRAGAAPEQEVDLTLRAPVGSELRYTYESRESSVETRPDGIQRRGSAEHSFGIILKVLRRDESGGAAEVSIGWYAMAVTGSSGNRTGFDSRNPKANEVSAPLEHELAPLLHKSVRVEFDDGGNVLDVVGADVLPDTQLTEKLRKELFSLDAMRRKVGPMLGVGRQTATAKVGDTWQRSDTIPVTLRFTMDVESRRTLVRIATDTAIIEDVSQVVVPPVDADAPVIPVVENASGACTQGWNIRKGVLDSLDAHQRMLISLTRDGEQRMLNVDLQESIRQGR